MMCAIPLARCCAGLRCLRRGARRRARPIVLPGLMSQRGRGGGGEDPARAASHEASVAISPAMGRVAAALDACGALSGGSRGS